MSMVEGGELLRYSYVVGLITLSIPLAIIKRARVGVYGDENSFFNGDACQH